MRPVALRLSLSASLVLIPLVIGAAPANAVDNTAPDCSGTAQTGYQANAIVAGGNQDPSDIDFVWTCDDADGDTLTVTAVSDGTHGSAAARPSDPDHELAYVQYSPDEGFQGRDQLAATVSDGTTTTEATIYVHVVLPTDSVDCQATYNQTYKQGDEPTDYPLNCFSYLDPPDDALTYTIDDVSPAGETGHVQQRSADLGWGVVPVLTFDDQIEASQVTVQVTATDTSGASDTVFVVLDNEHDPVCAAGEDDNGYVTLEQRSSNHAALTQDLGCTDPDGTALSYTAPTYYASNSDPTAPGNLEVSAAGVVTFTPDDPNWTGRAYFTGGEMTDGNNGWNNLDIVVDRYQQADMSVAFSATPSTVTIGSSYTANMHVVNAGPDPVSGVYIEIGVPVGSVLGTLPVACHGVNGSYLECDYDNIAANADFNVPIPLTAGPGSMAGVSEIGAQYAGANLRNTNAANDMTPANVTLVSAAVVVPGNDVVRGSAAGTTISTGAGDDRVDAGAGPDLVLLGTGNDCGQGGAGNDTVHGDAGNDAVYGDAGPCVAGQASTSRLMAAIKGSDRLFGDAGDDRLVGGPGADLLIGGSGRDTFLGGGGNDVIRARDHVRGERVNCGAGHDVVYADKGDIVARNCEKVHRR
jgi:Ca2+-binding RTX toxin-like protein